MIALRIATRDARLLTHLLTAVRTGRLVTRVDVEAGLGQPRRGLLGPVRAATILPLLVAARAPPFGPLPQVGGEQAVLDRVLRVTVENPPLELIDRERVDLPQSLPTPLIVGEVPVAGLILIRKAKHALVFIERLRFRIVLIDDEDDFAVRLIPDEDVDMVDVRLGLGPLDIAVVGLHRGGPFLTVRSDTRAGRPLGILDRDPKAVEPDVPFTVVTGILLALGRVGIDTLAGVLDLARSDGDLLEDRLELCERPGISRQGQRALEFLVHSEPLPVSLRPRTPRRRTATVMWKANLPSLGSEESP